MERAKEGVLGAGMGLAAVLCGIMALMSLGMGAWFYVVINAFATAVLAMLAAHHCGKAVKTTRR